MEKENVLVNEKSTELDKNRVNLVVFVLLAEPVLFNFPASDLCNHIHSIDRNVYVFGKQHVPIFAFQ